MSATPDPRKSKLSKFRDSIASYDLSSLTSDESEQVLLRNKSTPRKTPAPKAPARKSSPSSSTPRRGRTPKSISKGSAPTTQGRAKERTRTSGLKESTPRRDRKSRSGTPGSVPRLTPELIGLRTYVQSEDGQRLSMSSNTTESPTKPKVTVAEKHEIGIDVKVQGDEHATADDPDYAEWTQAERDLFNRLADRGVVPLLPSSWKLDFSTMPDQLFTDGDEEAFIDTFSGKDFQGTFHLQSPSKSIKAFSSLLLVGTRVRDSLLAGGDPTPVLQRSVDDYYKWCLHDGLVDRKRSRWPIFTTASTRNGKTTGEAVSWITREFATLAGHWQNDAKRNLERTPAGTRRAGELQLSGMEGEPLPTLYGIVIAKSVLAVVTYDANQGPADEAQARTIALFDFADDSQDVWNSFAVAILLITARNYEIHLRAGTRSERSADDPDT